LVADADTDEVEQKINDSLGASLSRTKCFLHLSSAAPVFAFGIAGSAILTYS
jgi:hypothetical protein